VENPANPWANPLTKNKKRPGIKKSENGEASNSSRGIPNLEPSGWIIIRNPAGIAESATID
jgi:hypothetical protein